MSRYSKISLLKKKENFYNSILSGLQAFCQSFGFSEGKRDFGKVLANNDHFSPY